MTDAIADLIPHAGAMVLLDAVAAWDAEHIICTATSHILPGNPLRVDDTLPVISGVEYAAQAMAAHGRLTAPTGGRPRGGVLASLRDVICHVERLDTIQSLLIVTARRLTGEATRVIYDFALTADGNTLIEGRAAVILEELPT